MNYVEGMGIMSNIKTVNLGLDPLNSRCQRKNIAWPIYVWKCILPIQMGDDIDVLQKLLLATRVTNKEQYFLVEKLGFSKDLLQSVREKCIDEGYLTNQGEVTDIGREKVINKNFYASDFDDASRCEKIYLLKDAISGDVIPNFSIDDIPRLREDKDDKLVLPENNSNRKKPSILDITLGLKTYHRLNKVRKENQQAYCTENIEISEYDFDDDEVEWTDIDEKGDIEVKGENKVQNYEDEKKKNIITNIKIWDNTPELIYVDSNIYIDPDKPNEWRVRSPLGRDEDAWFTSRLRTETYKNSHIKEEIDFFVEISRDELKDKYAFDNHYNIELFNQFPKIANYPEFKYLKDEIESVKRVELRIKGGDEDYDTLFLRCQKSLECLFGLCISKIKNRFDIVKNINKDDFKYQVNYIASQIGINLPQNYLSFQICKSLFYVPKLKSGSIKDRALFMLYDAYYNKDSTSLYILKAMPEFYENINLIANNRNNTSHFNHVSKEKTDFDKEVVQCLQCFNELIIVLFSHYFRG